MKDKWTKQQRISQKQQIASLMNGLMPKPYFPKKNKEIVLNNLKDCVEIGLPKSLFKDFRKGDKEKER